MKSASPRSQYPEITVFVRQDEARYINGSGRCPACDHLDVLHEPTDERGRYCPICEGESCVYS